MSGNKDDIGYDPVILPWLTSMVGLMNCTGPWYGGTLSLVLQLGTNIIACFFAYGYTENVQRTALVYIGLSVLHVTLSLLEELHYRDSFYQELTIRTLKESFEGTLEALP